MSLKKFSVKNPMKPSSRKHLFPLISVSRVLASKWSECMYDIKTKSVYPKRGVNEGTMGDETEDDLVQIPEAVAHQAKESVIFFKAVRLYD